MPPMSPPRPMESSRLCPSSLPGTPRKRMRPSFLRSFKISSEDKFDASIQAMPSSGIAMSRVARPIIREISAMRFSRTRIALSTKIVGPSALDFSSTSA